MMPAILVSNAAGESTQGTGNMPLPHCCQDLLAGLADGMSRAESQLLSPATHDKPFARVGSCSCRVIDDNDFSRIRMAPPCFRMIFQEFEAGDTDVAKHSKPATMPPPTFSRPATPPCCCNSQSSSQIVARLNSPFCRDIGLAAKLCLVESCRRSCTFEPVGGLCSSSLPRRSADLGL